MSNFAFLKSADATLARYPTEAERYFADDPEVCLYKLRLFGEQLTHLALDHLGVRSPAETQFQRLKQLEGQYGVTDRVLSNFHALRQVGNRASHAIGRIRHGDAGQQLRNARELAVWYMAEFVDPDVKVSGFTLPASGSAKRDQVLERELARRLEEESKHTSAQLETMRQRLSQPQVATFATVAQQLATLDDKVQRAVEKQLQKFIDDPAIDSLAPVANAVDPKVRLLTLKGGLGCAVVVSPNGDACVLTWLGPRDVVASWAAEHRFEVHPVLGSLQIFAPAAAEASVNNTAVGSLFETHSDEELISAGLPRPLLPAVRMVASEEALDQLTPHLPEEAADVLYALAAGFSLAEAMSEASKVLPQTVDTNEFGPALEHPDSKRRFQLHAPGTPLDEALRGSLEAWRVYLHPAQEQLVRMQARGPVKVLGGAGTGKTVALMHRAAYLATHVFDQSGDHLLVTTFTKNLAIELRRNMRKLVPKTLADRIQVQNLHAYAVSLVKRAGQSVNVIDDETSSRLWKTTLLDSAHQFSPAFLRDEWRDVVQAQEVQSEREYLTASRRGRGTALTRAQRRALWPTFASYRALLARDKLCEWDDVLRQARALFDDGVLTPPFRAVLVDELQDLGPLELRLLRALAPIGDNDMFLVGDPHQRIYGRQSALSRCGIEARGGRARKLRVNYRTTAAVARWAARRLADVPFDDLDEGRDSLRGYHSLRPGSAPEIRHFETPEQELEGVVEQVQSWLLQHSPSSICITARHHSALSPIEVALSTAAIPWVALSADKSPRAEDAVRVATMHRMKGLEFPAVLIAGSQLLPHQPDPPPSDEVAVRAHEANERSLLYVAATRARDALVVTGHGQPSPFVVR